MISSSGSLPCENPGQRPIPPPAPLQPAGSAESVGMQDPYVQIMQSQSAMSMLMMQSFELSRDVLEVSCEENRTSLGHHPGS